MQELTAILPVAWAATHVLPTPAIPFWAWSLAALVGIVCILLAIWTRRQWFLLPGLVLTLLDAFVERDITLGIAVIIAGIGTILVSDSRGN